MSKFKEGLPDVTSAIEHLPPYPEIHTKLRELIRAEHSVLVIGPSASSFYDASLLFVAHLLGRGNGKLFVVDPVSSRGASNAELEKKVGGIVTGIGNIDRYIDEIRVLKSKGLDLKEPEWLGEESGAQKILLPDYSLDVIIDHNTSVFLAGLPDAAQEEKRQETLHAIYNEYRRVLKVNGKLLLQTNAERYKLNDKQATISLKKLLENSGFSIERCIIDDSIEIPIDQRVYQNLSSFADENDPSRFFLMRTKGGEGGYVLRFDSPDQPSPNLYICNKL